MESWLGSCRPELGQQVAWCFRPCKARTALLQQRARDLRQWRSALVSYCRQQPRNAFFSGVERARTKCAAASLTESQVKGSPESMQIHFREVDTFNLWVWFELHQDPSEDDLELLDAVLSSWFMIGRLGGYNAMNLQAMYVGSETISFMKYDHAHSESALQATFHDMGSLERKGKWCRCWFNLGTADELALDVLINALINFSTENVGIKKCLIGGVNTEWPVPSMQADS